MKKYFFLFCAAAGLLAAEPVKKAQLPEGASGAVLALHTDNVEPVKKAQLPGGLSGAVIALHIENMKPDTVQEPGDSVFFLRVSTAEGKAFIENSTMQSMIAVMQDKSGAEFNLPKGLGVIAYASSAGKLAFLVEANNGRGGYIFQDSYSPLSSDRYYLMLRGAIHRTEPK